MSLRVLTLNLLHDYGAWKDRCARIRDWLDELDPDLVGLQEVLSGETLDQCAELLQGRGFHLDFLEAARFWKDTSLAFGNAVASRWPILERHALHLPEGGDGETRSALQVRVDAPPGPIALTVTHLNWRFDHGWVRERQVVALAEFVLKHRPRAGFPPILVGDFNADPSSTEIRYVKGLHALDGRSLYLRDAWEEAGGEGDGFTWSNRNDLARLWLEPDRRIDYVFVGPPQRGGVGMTTRCRVVCDEARDGIWPSDHFGVFAELRDEPDPSLIPPE